MKNIFKVSCEYFIKANSQEEAEIYVKEESGIDFFDSHLIVLPYNKNIGDSEIDIDLTK